MKWIKSPRYQSLLIVIFQIIYLYFLFGDSIPVSLWDIRFFSCESFKNLPRLDSAPLLPNVDSFQNSNGFHLSTLIPALSYKTTWGTIPIMLKATLSAIPSLFIVFLSYFFSPFLSLKISIFSMMLFSYIIWIIALRKYFEKSLPAFFFLLSLYSTYLAMHAFIMIEVSWVAATSGLILYLLQKKNPFVFITTGILSIFLLHLKLSTLPLLLVIYFFEQDGIRSHWKSLLKGISIASPLLLLNILSLSAFFVDAKERFTPSIDGLIVIGSSFIKLLQTPSFIEGFFTNDLVAMNFQSFQHARQLISFSFSPENTITLIVLFGISVLSFFYQRRAFYLMLSSICFFIVTLLVSRNSFHFDFFIYLVPVFFCLVLSLFEMAAFAASNPLMKKILLSTFFSWIGVMVFIIYAGHEDFKNAFFNQKTSPAFFAESLEKKCSNKMIIVSSDELSGFFEFFTQHRLKPIYISSADKTPEEILDRFSINEKELCLVLEDNSSYESKDSYGLVFYPKRWRIINR